MKKTVKFLYALKQAMLTTQKLVGALSNKKAQNGSPITLVPERNLSKIGIISNEKMIGKDLKSVRRREDTYPKI